MKHDWVPMDITKLTQLINRYCNIAEQYDLYWTGPHVWELWIMYNRESAETIIRIAKEDAKNYSVTGSRARNLLRFSKHLASLITAIQYNAPLSRKYTAYILSRLEEISKW